MAETELSSPRARVALPDARRDDPRLVAALLAFQIFCEVVFIWDVAYDFWEAGWSMWSDMKLLPEFIAVIGLALAIVFVSIVFKRMRSREARLEKGMSVARGALGEMIEGYFASWGLTQAEQAIASYTIKGFSIAEIAGLRQSAEGTIKTHLNAIYRKAGVSGRAQLISLLVEDLLNEPLVGATTAAGQKVS